MQRNVSLDLIELIDVIVKAFLVSFAFCIAIGAFNSERIKLYEYMDSRMGRRTNPLPIALNVNKVQELLATEFMFTKTEIDNFTNVYVECHAIRDDKCFNATVTVSTNKGEQRLTIGDFERVRRWAYNQVNASRWVSFFLATGTLVLSFLKYLCSNLKVNKS